MKTKSLLALGALCLMLPAAGAAQGLPEFLDAGAAVGGDPDGKIHKLLEFAGRSGDVADPWYSDRFDIAWRDIYDGCAGLLETLLDE